MLFCCGVMAYCVWLCRRRLHRLHPLAPLSLILASAGVLWNAMGQIVADQHPENQFLGQLIGWSVYGVLLSAAALGAYALWRFRNLRSRPLDGPWPGKRYALLAIIGSLGLASYLFVMSHGGQDFLNRLPTPYADTRAGILALNENDERNIWMLHLSALLVSGIVIIFAISACRRANNPVRLPGPLALIFACAGVLVFVVGLDLISGFDEFRKGRLLLGAATAACYMASLGTALFALWRYRNERARPIDGAWPGRSYAYWAMSVSLLMFMAMGYYAATLKSGLPLNPARWKLARGMHMFPQAGCAFKLPPEWTLQDVTRFQPDPLFVATRSNPNLSMALVATPQSGGATDKIQTLVQLTIDDLIKSGAEVHSPRYEADAMNEAQGGWLSLRVKRGKGKFVYAVWLCIHKEWNYRFYLWAPVENLTIVRDSGQQLQQSCFFWFKEPAK
jgi:hypothetical protein